MPNQCRVLFAENEERLQALLDTHYEGWTYFSPFWPFDLLESDRNFDLGRRDRDDLTVQGPGVMTVAFKDA